MAINRVSQVAAQQFQDKQLNDAQLMRRIALHTDDTLERVKSVKTAEGLVALPLSDPSQTNAMRELYTNANPEQRAGLAQAGNNLAQALYDSPNIGSTSSGLQNAMTHAFQEYMTTNAQANVETMTQGVMYMAYDGIEQDVFGLAEQLKGNIDAQRNKREEIAEFRNTIADWPEGAETQEFTWTDQNGVEHTEKLTKGQAEAKMQELESQLSTMKDMTQQWQLDLQAAMNKQQQALQMLSSIMKSFHDTAKSIIGNMR